MTKKIILTAVILLGLAGCVSSTYNANLNTTILNDEVYPKR